MNSTPLSYTITAGKPFPMGATVTEHGVNFSLFSSRAEKIELCLFDEQGKETRLTLPERSGLIHHGFVPHIGVGQRYGYRVYGRNDPLKGAVFNPQKLLTDPYSKQIDGIPHYRNAAEMAWYQPHDLHDNAAIAPKSIVVGKSDFDWENDTFPNTSWANTVIYEAHVKGFTQQFPDLAHAGTYTALADPRVIAYLQNLGITAIELLPVHQHLDEHHLQAAGLSNYWGYNTYSHFAVEPSYAHQIENAANELRQAIKALHAAGIEVILDVVYNHTAEQDWTGPMLCQRGIDNPAWYWINPADGEYRNWSGCGNTLNIVRRDITRWAADSLRYWVQEFHIDGFRFDLGTVLGREPDFQAYGRFFQVLYQDPILSERKLIVEAWDIGEGGYHVGNFPHPFGEWNGGFRDDMREFWLWESGKLGLFAQRLSGSADIFRRCGRRPSASINFIAAHDGFTLHDLVSYNEKHNHANGEQNRDGHNHNISYNHGVEGNTTDPTILQEREYSSKAMLASLLLANGTPMLLGGDEFGNSQQGNNNGYCQDNEITWLDWHHYHATLANYVRELLKIRQEIHLLGQEDTWWDNRVEWLNAQGLPMTENDWHNTNNKTLQVLIDKQWLLLINGKRSSQTFVLPQGTWTCRLAPSLCHDYVPPQCHVTHMGLWIFHKTGEIL